MNLRELSDLLGLSQTTVSRALNGYPEVREATRKRVAEAAKAHNYHPNTRAKSLATGRTMSIGHVIPLSSQHEMVNCVFSDFIAGAGESYARRGYDMRVSVVDDAEEAEAYMRLAQTGKVDGVIVHGPRLDDERIPLLHNLGLPFVVHGRSTNCETPYSWLDVNNRSAFRRATDFLLDLGHRRFGLVNGIEEMDFAHRRRDGYTSALQDRGIVVDPALTHAFEMTEPFGYAKTCEMLDGDAPPTAIIASSLIPALGVRRAVEERGLVMGKDVSIICFDDALSYLPNGAGSPIFTATRSSVRDAGRRCGEMLMDQIEGQTTDPVHELWEAELVVGGSTGPAPMAT
ncbi:substrate-binding domain-containing protein [Litoreibacter arenae]|uniref:Transcriptional regulator AglR, LacI family n=1 Tax=Litoreibacter arenae DSM 19593 TaxID=1123360 RepID=S9RYA8_9RHOB|nr:substrate-binding domain-containing protein [Litoreibacter arenae]EPX78964.1 Transcriptional regulator AglR, LacI family [Litoreibacter arenae DSM 19593]